MHKKDRYSLRKLPSQFSSHVLDKAGPLPQYLIVEPHCPFPSNVGMVDAHHVVSETKAERLNQGYEPGNAYETQDLAVSVQD